MPKIKIWNGIAWVMSDASNADTLDSKHAADFLQKSPSSADGCFDTTATTPVGTSRLNYSGYFYATKIYNAVFNDYAEYFLKDEEMESGDLVCKNPDGSGYIKSKSFYSKLVIGVISDQYAQCIGGDKDLSLEEQEKRYAPIGMCGRVDVKVTGKVNTGDLLVSSHIPGIAMAAKEYIPGTVIGKALEPYLGEEAGKVKMLIMNC